MNPKKVPTKPVERSQYHGYQKKALEFYQSMVDAFNAKMWNSVGLNAIHCIISISDALLVNKCGIRSTSQDHGDIVYLLTEHINDKQVKQYANHLSRVIEKKNLVEDEGRTFDQKDADDIMRHTERFVNWAKGLLS